MNSVERFSSRVENYAKFRPGYPPGILDVLKSDCGLTKESVIADIGSGTGLLSEVFLKQGDVVFGIEPNELMRAKAEELLKSFANFRSVPATAETTTLPDGSVDFVTAGQAFHWFDLEAAKREFERVLKRDGWVVLVWNERKLDSTPFLHDYEKLLLRYGTDYETVRQENVIERIPSFYAPNSFQLCTFENRQVFNWPSLKGRVSSASYTPPHGSARFESMLLELRKLYNRYADNGTIAFEYETKMFYGTSGQYYPSID